MLIQIIFAIVAGCILGTITGITPGLHINLVATIILSLSPILLKHFNPLILAIVIVAMSFVHVFTDFIPSIFLGAPASETALSVLPGHKLLLQGKGFQAVTLTTIGSFLGLIVVLLLSPLLLVLVPIIFKVLRRHIGMLLLLLIIFMVLREREFKKRIWAVTVVVLSGILGMIVLNSNMNEPLLPLLSGLFGVSTLLLSITTNVNLPEQTLTVELPSRKEMFRSVLAGSFSGGIVSIFPAVGPAQAAILGEQLLRKINDYSYLLMMGSINTVSMFLSLITLYTISKARNGSIVVMSQLLQLNSQLLIILFLVALISGAIAVIISLKVSKVFTNIINKISYKKLCFGVIALIVVMVLKFSGIKGIIVLTIATMVGIIPNKKQINRSNAMGCLLLPVIRYYL